MDRDPPWRVGIIGTRWGRTHVGTFRASGCIVHAIVGRDPQRSASVAAEEGIAHHEEAALADCDIVVVATPIASHRDLLARHCEKVVFCEKPLLGRAPDAEDRALVARTSLAVNYAFAFLDTPTRMQELVLAGAIGELLDAHLRVDVRLGAPQPAIVWLREVAVHPLSWLHHAWGPVATGEHTATPERVSGMLSLAGRPLALDVRCGQAEGIAIELAITGDHGRLTTSGGYRPGAGWSFAPIHLGTVAENDGEHATGEDIWYRANRRAVATFVAQLDGRIDADTARARGLFTGQRALELEAGLGPLLTGTTAP